MKKDFATFFVAIAIIASVLCLSKAIIDKAHADHESTEDDVPTVYIVYTDEESQPYAVPTVVTSPRKSVPLTADERDKIASIVAGKSGSKPVSVQLMVANVVMNDLLACNGDLEDAVSEFQLDTYATPTKDQYDVVDAVFERGELSLDEDVLYMRKTGSKSSFHDSRTFVCEYFGISFYK